MGGKSATLSSPTRQWRRRLKRIARARLLWLILLPAVALTAAGMVFWHLSQLPALGNDLSKWNVVVGATSVLGAVAATAAVLVALFDRVARERPNVMLQTASFRFDGTTLEAKDAVVNVGGGPALGVLVRVTTSDWDFQVFGNPMFHPDESDVQRIPHDWFVVTDLIRSDEGSYEALMGRQELDMISIAAYAAFLRHFAELAEEGSRTPLPPRLEIILSTRLEVQVSYSDRGGVVPTRPLKKSVSCTMRISYEDPATNSGLESRIAGEVTLDYSDRLRWLDGRGGEVT